MNRFTYSRTHSILQTLEQMRPNDEQNSSPVVQTSSTSCVSMLKALITLSISRNWICTRYRRQKMADCFWVHSRAMPILLTMKKFKGDTRSFPRRSWQELRHNCGTWRQTAEIFYSE